MGDFSIPILVMIFVGVLIVCGIGYGVYSERKRREALQRVAEELGLAFYPDGDPALMERLSDLQLFSKGRSRRIANLIHGETEEVVMGIFDYRFTTGSGKNSHTYHQSVAFFRASDLDLPRFEMRPQRFLHGIGKMFGYQDIDFESHPVFSKNFLLQGSDEEQVRGWFHPQLLTCLEQRPGICLEGHGQDLVLYRHAKRLKAEQLHELMREGFEIFTLIRGGPGEA